MNIGKDALSSRIVKDLEAQSLIATNKTDLSHANSPGRRSRF